MDPVRQGMRIIAIGDIHGHDHLLKSVLRQIEENYIDKRTTIVFMGDYLNRSPSAEACRATLTMIQDFEAKYPAQTFLLRGNHEWNFIQKIDLDVDQMNITQPWEFEIYREFESLLKGTMPYYETDEYFFAHAGGVMKNGKFARKENTPESLFALYWRYELPDEPYEKTVVRAHKIVDPDEVFGENLISIDLGSYQTGKLGAVVLPDNILIVSD
jgi:hypothetical protein